MSKIEEKILGHEIREWMEDAGWEYDKDGNRFIVSGDREIRNKSTILWCDARKLYLSHARQVLEARAHELGCVDQSRRGRPVMTFANYRGKFSGGAPVTVSKRYCDLHEELERIRKGSDE
jgi:hypothetical protein